MNRPQAFRVASLTALAAWVGVVLVAAIIATSGAIGLSGWSDYRYEIEVPVPGLSLDVGFQPSWGVGQVGDVCERFDVRHPADDCYNFVLHQGTWVEGDVMADHAVMSGPLYLDARPGWNLLMASLYGMKVLSLLVLAFMLAQLWLLLRTVARGQGFSEHSFLPLRILGWTMVAWEFLEPALWLFFSPKANDYTATAAGPWPLLQLESMEPGGPAWLVIAFGFLLILLAELFRYGAELADEQRLTV